MLARVRSGALGGIDALVVDVEVDVSSGLPHTTIEIPLKNILLKVVTAIL